MKFQTWDYIKQKLLVSSTSYPFDCKVLFGILNPQSEVDEGTVEVYSEKERLVFHPWPNWLQMPEAKHVPGNVVCRQNIRDGIVCFTFYSYLRASYIQWVLNRFRLFQISPKLNLGRYKLQKMGRIGRKEIYLTWAKFGITGICSGLNGYNWL